MNRREFTASCLGAVAVAGLAGANKVLNLGASEAFAVPESIAARAADTSQLHVSFVMFEGMTALDFLGPATVLSTSGKCIIDYVWRDMKPVYAEGGCPAGLGFMPTATFADIEKTDIICIAGTSNPYAQLNHTDMIDWVAKVGKTAQWVTSVCTGSFVLGAAGLLKGYKATAHWSMVEDLAYFGAIPTFERVVQDRNRLTGGGVTSGIDFALTLLDLIAGEDVAKKAQLALEYDPHPPFNSGSPQTANPQLVAEMKQGLMLRVTEHTPDAQQRLEGFADKLGVVSPK